MMEYSAAGVKYLLWYVETKETAKLMHNPELLLYFTEDEYVRIPTKVIDELGKIKDKRNQKYDASLSDTARRIARDIDMYYLQLFNRQNKIRFLIENAVLDLLPKDLDAKVPDNQILSVALKYKDWETYIVSDDGVFRLTAQAQSIQVITGAKFIEMHQDSKKELTEWIKSANAQSADISSVVTETVVESKVEIPVETKKEEKQVTTTVTTADATVSDSEEPAIGAFRMLTESKVRNLPAKGKQMVYKNTVMRAVKQMNTIIPKIKLK